MARVVIALSITFLPRITSNPSVLLRRFGCEEAVEKGLKFDLTSRHRLHQVHALLLII